jgi:hypothetical protein
LFVYTVFPLAHANVETRSLIDSGCSGKAFIDRLFAQFHKLPMFPMPKARPLLLANGHVSDTLTEYTILPMKIGSHHEPCLFYVTTLAANTPVILGLPWLRRHNPSIDWSSMSMQMDSWYCQRHCCSGDCILPTVTAPPSPRSPTKALYHVHFESNYRPPSVVDAADIKPPQAGGIPMELAPELTPGRQHYRTRRVNPLEETRGLMVPSRPDTKPAPARIVRGRRIQSRPPSKNPLPPLSVPLPQPQPQPHTEDCYDFDDIKVSNAPSFLAFCRQPNVRASRTTWAELDAASSPPPNPFDDIPNLTEEEFWSVMLGQVPETLYSVFPTRFHGFLNECKHSVYLRSLKPSDIEKFMKGKLPLTDDELEKKLPDWLQDKLIGFIAQKADELPPRRAWDHKIDITPGKEPPYQKNRPFSPPELQVIRKWLDDNLDKGFIRESRARCAAPLLLAAKPGSGVRICQDYRGLNNVTIKNRYPLPLIRETLDALCNAKWYTKLDIIAAFNKLRIAEGHEWKTAFITRFGLFESLVMPFGLCNAPASFQNYINHTLHDLLDRTCTAYLDDVLIYSANKAEHRKHVREVVQRLIDAGLQIDIQKCEFEVTETKYLGLIVSPGGIKMDPEKVATIASWLEPPHLKDLQKFLGFANFYQRFIQGFSKICQPLNKLLRKDTLWLWTTEHTKAFEALKSAFASAPVLAMYDFTKKTILETDASDWASGGVLSQYDENGILRPVAYFSSKHSGTECNYEIYDKELLAIIKSLEEWRPELQGSAEPFEIITDHKNLEYFTTTKALSQRQVRWSEFLSQFNFRITYRPGSRAIRPDALSRLPGYRPNKNNFSDDRVKNRLRTVLPPEVFDPAVLQELTAGSAVHAAPILLPAMDKPIDDLIQTAYERSDMAQDMIKTLADPALRRWPTHLRKIIRVPMVDCELRQGRVWYRDRQFAPPDDELRTQILY